MFINLWVLGMHVSIFIWYPYNCWMCAEFNGLLPLIRSNSDKLSFFILAPLVFNYEKTRVKLHLHINEYYSQNEN